MADAPDTMMQEAAARLAAAAAAAVPVPRSERQQYPVHMAVDFTQLRVRGGPRIDFASL